MRHLQCLLVKCFTKFPGSRFHCTTRGAAAKDAKFASLGSASLALTLNLLCAQTRPMSPRVPGRLQWRGTYA